MHRVDSASTPDRVSPFFGLPLFRKARFFDSVFRVNAAVVALENFILMPFLCLEYKQRPGLAYQASTYRKTGLNLLS